MFILGFFLFYYSVFRTSSSFLFFFSFLFFSLLIFCLSSVFFILTKLLSAHSHYDRLKIFNIIIIVFFLLNYKSTNRSCPFYSFYSFFFHQFRYPVMQLFYFFIKNSINTVVFMVVNTKAVHRLCLEQSGHIFNVIPK